MTDFDRCNVAPLSVEPGRGAPCPAVGAALTQRRTLSSEQQYLADLEVIARCEEQIERQAGCPCFFACMGAIASRGQA